MERLISVLGLLVLLGIAYAFSVNRRAINFRTTAWGVGLQLLLALTILGSMSFTVAGVEVHISFIGMFLLAFLVVLYVFEEEFHKRAAEMGDSGPWVVGVATFVASAAVVVLFRFLAQYQITLVLLIAAALAVVVGIRLGRTHLSRVAFASTLVLGVAELWSRDVYGKVAFQALSDKVAYFLGLSNSGAAFLFGNLVTDGGIGATFAFSVLPTIIFFAAFMAVMYHLGIVQVVISALSRFMRWSMRTSGSETMSCSANTFVGQTEAPFLIRPFIKDMTISELHAIMVGGFATVAGGVLAGFISMGIDPGHLIAASFMSAPAALVLAKLLLPETEHSKTAGDVEIPDIRTSDNVVEAAASGTADGLKLALNVGAMLIAFIALIAVVDVVFGYFDGLIDGRLLGGTVAASGEYAGFFPGSLKTLFGTVLRPLAWVMGVPWQDSMAVGNLLGIKLSVNEFVGYGVLGQHIAAGDLQPRSIIIATYALCGFANFSSIGIQIGGISALVPERRKDLAKVGVRAMFGGALASWTTATIAGMFLTS